MCSILTYTLNARMFPVFSPAQEAESWQVPALLLYSGNDKLVRSKSSDLFSEQAPSHLVEAHCFKEMHHEILNDPEKEKVFTILNQWLAANLK